MEGTYTRIRQEPFEVIEPQPEARVAGDHTPRSALAAGAAGIGLLCIMLLLLTGMVGCQDSVSLIPNPDPDLQKTRSEFARDAISRHPYHAEAPRAGKIQGGASVDYEGNTMHIANFTSEDWKDVEIWINGQWVVFVPSIPGKAETARKLNFEMMYDRMGRHFPIENIGDDSMVKKVEIYRDGKMYELAGLSIE